MKHSETIVNKCGALVLWFRALKIREHKHYCKLDHGFAGRCPHQLFGWTCNRLFCTDGDRKDCYACAVLTDDEKWALTSKKLRENAKGHEESGEDSLSQLLLAIRDGI